MTASQIAAVTAFCAVTQPKSLADCHAAVSTLTAALPAADLARAGAFYQVRSLHDFRQLQDRVRALPQGDKPKSQAYPKISAPVSTAATAVEMAALRKFSAVQVKTLCEGKDAIAELFANFATKPPAGAINEEIRTLDQFRHFQEGVRTHYTKAATWGPGSAIGTATDREARAKKLAAYKALTPGQPRLDYFRQHRADLEQACRES